ncbi:MAG: hypothetical protein ACE5E6_05290 [Phycisphaerae bacterium]
MTHGTHDGTYRPAGHAPARRRGAPFAFIVLGPLMLAGCGALLPPFPGALLADSMVDGALTTMSLGVDQIIVLDWTGGQAGLYPDRDVAAIDLAAFPVADGTTLAAESDVFQDRVQRRVVEILGDLTEFRLYVTDGEAEDFASAVTVVQVAQELPPDASKEIGRAEYDPCNLQDDNAAVIFGEQILRLSGTYTFDEWVTVFANVCAHEIAHTLGYGHLPRTTYGATDRSAYVELMLDGHTMSEMRREQRFLNPMSHCPTGDNQSAHLADNVHMNCAISE